MSDTDNNEQWGFLDGETAVLFQWNKTLKTIFIHGFNTESISWKRWRESLNFESAFALRCDLRLGHMIFLSKDCWRVCCEHFKEAPLVLSDFEYHDLIRVFSERVNS